jgi:hypothetical protein
VAAGAHGRQQLVLAGKIDGVLHIGCAGAARDQCRLLVEHRVPEAARPVVVGTGRQQHLAAQAGSEGLDRRSGQHDLAAGKGLGRHVADALEHGAESTQWPGCRKRKSATDEMTPLHDDPPET